MSTINSLSPFESLLVDKGILTPEQLDQVRELSASGACTVAEALEQLDMLSHDDIVALQADANHVRFLKLEDVEIDREAIRHVPAAIAYRYKLIPVRRSGNSLVIAFSDPTNSEARDALSRVTDFEIVPFVSPPDTIEHALLLHYGEVRGDGDSLAKAVNRGDSMISAMPTQDERFAHAGRSVPIRRDWTFDTFIEDTGSRHPLSLARAMVTDREDSRSCPIILWGDPGSGKSHLLHAIANYLTTHEPLKKYVLTTGEQFAESLYDSLRGLKQNLFRYFYRDVQYLLLDNVDDLLSKPWAQRELVDIISHLKIKQAWVVLTSRSDLTLESRIIPELLDIFSQGTAAPFTAYSTDGRTKIMMKHIGKVGMPQDAIARLSEEFKGSLPELMDVVRQVTAISVMEQRDISDEVVNDLLTMYGACKSAEQVERKGSRKKKHEAHHESDDNTKH